MWSSLHWLMVALAISAPEPGANDNLPAPVHRAEAGSRGETSLCGRQLAAAIGREMLRWRNVPDEQAAEAARRLFALYLDLRNDEKLTNPQRTYYGKLLCNRLGKLCDQIRRHAATAAHEGENPPQSASLATGKSQQGQPTAAAPARLGRPDRLLAQRAGPRPAGVGTGGPNRFTGGRLPNGSARFLTGQIPDNGLELVELIQSVIAPNTWAQNGGKGTIHYWRGGRALVIRQTDEVHRQVSGALEQLRRAGN